jgi:predicted nucleic acid-binding Zn finger protein
MTVIEKSEAEVLEAVCGSIRAEGTLSTNHVNALVTKFGQRVNKALEALSESRIKKYVFQPSGRIVWIVVGKERDYLVMPAGGYCSCDDFYYQFDHGHVCYHMIAQKLAESVGRFDLFEDDDTFYDILLQEWKQPEEHPPPKKKKAASDEGTV